MIFLQDFLKTCKDYLRKKGVDSPELCAELIFAHCLNISRLDVIISKELLPKDSLRCIMKLILRRGEGEPLAYILGKKEFYGRDFWVNENVLIPRGCTETIIDVCKTLYRSNEQVVFLDIGTGSGNIAITLLCEFENFSAVAVDISFNALMVAKKNSLMHGVMDRILPINSNLLSSFKNKKVDLIVSNPPYLSRDLFEKASFEVKGFEPYLALFGGNDGLEIPKQIFLQAKDVLKENGRILMELDSSQMVYMKEFLVSMECWKDMTIYRDLEGHDRIIGASLI